MSSSATLDDFFCFSCDEPPLSYRVGLAREVPGAYQEWVAERARVGWLGTVPLCIHVYQGTKGAPILSSGLGDPVLSTPLLEIFERHRFSGALLRGATVYDQRQREVMPIRAGILRAEIGCGPVDRTRGISGKIFNREHCKDETGVFFDPSTWTGLEVFRCADNLQIIIHRRVADILTAAQIPGLIIEKAAEYNTHFVRKHAWFFSPQDNPLPRPSTQGGFGTAN